eukprot:evm.model.scf_3060.1 EVM.evm.TU.scf_3060.1   scf_3060:816-11466(+)
MYRQNFVFSAEIVRSGPDGVSPTIVVATPLKKYHFNVAEGFGRLAMEHGVKIDHRCSVFFTFDHTPASVGGLGGLLFRLREVGMGQILFVGPKGINEILEGFKMLSYFKEPMLPSCSPLTGRSQGVVYGDDFIDVAAVLKDWERSTTPSWLGACPRWVQNPKQVINLAGDDELEEGELDERDQGVIAIDIGVSDDDADRQSDVCLSHEETQADGLIDLVTTDDDEVEVQAADSVPGKLTSSGTSSSTGDGNSSSSCSSGRNGSSSSSSQESTSVGSAVKPLPGLPQANNEQVLSAQIDPLESSVDAAAESGHASLLLQEMISLSSDSSSSWDEDCMLLAECKQDPKHSGTMHGEVKDCQQTLGLHGEGVGGWPRDDFGFLQPHSTWVSSIPYPGHLGCCKGAGMDCRLSQPFTQGDFHPSYAKHISVRKEILQTAPDMEVDPVLAYVMQIKATGQILAIIRLTDAASKEDLESHPVFKGLKNNRSRVSAIFHILRQDVLDIPSYQTWASRLPGKQIMVKGEAQGLGEELGHQKVLKLTGRLHAISSLFFPLPYQARKDPMAGVKEGCEHKGALEGGLLFRIEQSLHRELEVIPGCPSITSLGSLLKETEKTPEVQEALQVLRALNLSPEFDPWHRLHEEFQDLSSAAPRLEAHLPSLEPHISKTNSDGHPSERAGVASHLLFGGKMARLSKSLAPSACTAAAGVDSAQHGDRDGCPACQEQFHHVEAENQIQWRYQHGAQRFMCQMTAQHKVERDHQQSFHDSKRQAVCSDIHHESVLGLMAKRMDRSRVLFLGTGCAEPSPYRTGTGILLQTAHDAYLMIDAGENTMGQLVRMFGHEGAHHVVQRLQCVWVSHHHGDHSLGLPGLLAARDPMGPPIVVVGPVVIGRWLRKVGHWLKLRYIFLYHRDLNLNPLALAARVKLGILAWESFRVEHCYDAWGLSVQHTSGWKLVFTGDTKVCENVVKAAQHATLLIHEASFGPLHEETAAKALHSTWEQALRCSQQAKAYRTILTHFSNRYPGYPEEDGRSPELGDRAAIAFDGLQVPLVALRYLPAFNDAFKRAIAASSDFRSERCQRR